MNIRKNVFIALTILLAPLLPYLHLLSLGKEPDFSLWKSFKNSFHVKYEFDTWIYSLLSYLLLFVLFFIWRANSKTFLRTSLDILVIWSFIMSLITFFDIREPFRDIIKLIIVVVVVSLFLTQRIKLFSRKEMLWQKVVVILILGVPLINNTWYFVPEGVGRIDFYLFEITSMGFNDASQFYYVIVKKISLFSVFFLWFLMEEKWWRFAILSPIILFGNQINNLLFFPDQGMDEFELFQSGPFLLLLTLLLILLAKLVDNQERIRLVLEDKYSQLEQLVQERLKKRQTRIDSNRKRISSNSLKTEELQELKKELEKELKRKV